jgi:hypothetical protein
VRRTGQGEHPKRTAVNPQFAPYFPAAAYEIPQKTIAMLCYNPPKPAQMTNSIIESMTETMTTRSNRRPNHRLTQK